MWQTLNSTDVMNSEVRLLDELIGLSMEEEFYKLSKEEIVWFPIKKKQRKVPKKNRSNILLCTGVNKL